MLPREVIALQVSRCIYLLGLDGRWVGLRRVALRSGIKTPRHFPGWLRLISYDHEADIFFFYPLFFAQVH